MSQENVEIVRAHLEAYLRGDNDAALAAYDPEVVFDVSLRPEGRPYYGRDGVAEALRVWTGTWEDWRLAVEQVIDAGDKVLAVVRESGRGKGSGVEINQRVFGLFTLREGKIVHRQGFLSEDEALAAAGLAE